MSDSPKIAVSDVVEAVSAHTGVTTTDIVSQRRSERIAHARHLCCWLACRHTHLSMSTIGARLGGRDVTTILYARKKIEAMRADPRLREELDGLEAAIAVVARLRERRLVPAPRVIDPHEVARRVLEDDGDRAAGLVSIAEIKALCAALTAARPDRHLQERVGEVVEARRALEQARYTAGERHARARLERALESLANNGPKAESEVESAHA